MTYADYSMTKKAETDPSEYENIAAKMKAGDTTTQTAMSVPTNQEILWNLLGAGLGAGGAYLLSRRFRRNPDKRMRALDMILGALVGFGGTQLALNLPADEKSGLSLKETLRADKLIGSGSKTGDNSQGVEHPSAWRPNTATLGGAGGGAVIGGIAAGAKGLVRDPLSKRFMGSDMKLYEVPRDHKLAISAAKRGQRYGSAIDVGAGGLVGAAGGYGLGALFNYLADKNLEGQYAGGMN